MNLPPLFKLIHHQQWDIAFRKLSEYQEWTNKHGSTPSVVCKDQLQVFEALRYQDCGGWTLLHLACSMRSIPTKLVQILCNLNPQACITRDEDGGNTPLHVAVWTGNASVVRQLLRQTGSGGATDPDSAGSAVLIEDFSSRKALDLLCETYSGLIGQMTHAPEGNMAAKKAQKSLTNPNFDSILEIEEGNNTNIGEMFHIYTMAMDMLVSMASRVQYLKNPCDCTYCCTEPKDKNCDLKSSHCCSHFVANGNYLVLHAGVFLVVHRHLKASSATPLLRLLAHAAKEDLLTPDLYGNLPLHLASMAVPLNDNDYESSKFTASLIEYLIKVCPEAAKIENNAGQTPLKCAIYNGKKWTKENVGALIKAYPLALQKVHLPVSSYPVTLSFLFNELNNLGAVYVMIRSAPHIIQPNTFENFDH